MGQQKGLGVTHLSIALANYTAGRLHAKTALVEFEERNTLAGLFGKETEEEFELGGVTYFPSVSSYELGIIYNMDFQYIIIDLGADRRTAREELMRCSGKLIVGSLCPWRKTEYYDYIKQIQENTGNLDMYIFLALFEDRIEIKKCRRTFKARVQSIPFIANPFCVKDKEAVFLHSFV